MFKGFIQVGILTGCVNVTQAIYKTTCVIDFIDFISTASYNRIGLAQGIGGEQNNAGETIDDVAKNGCLCHNADADNSVQIILDDVPFAWEAGQTYEMKLQIIGGPAAASPWTAGFSMRVSAGVLSGENLQNWEEDLQTLTHTEASANKADRMWTPSWEAPEETTGAVDFWITGNSVNGDNINGPEDKWNQLIFALQEDAGGSAALGTRTLFAGDGNVTHQNQPKRVST